MDHGNSLKVRANKFADGMNGGDEKRGRQKSRIESRFWACAMTRWTCHSLRMGRQGRSRPAGVRNQESRSAHTRPRSLLGTPVQILDRTEHI